MSETSILVHLRREDDIGVVDLPTLPAPAGVEVSSAPVRAVMFVPSDILAAIEVANRMTAMWAKVRDEWEAVLKSAPAAEV